MWVVPSSLEARAEQLTLPPLPVAARRPSTEAEREEWGDTLHEGQGKNLARGFVDAVRGRKGLPVERKVVAHAEKQRTLSRKK
jgi:hypothetical protein